MDNLRKLSKAEWDNPNTLEAINAGSLQRIADATEKMAVRHTELMAERDRYKRWYEEECASVKRMCKTISCLRGVITKLKKPKPDPVPEGGAQ